jgi:hypothetical protein
MFEYHSGIVYIAVSKSGVLMRSIMRTALVLGLVVGVSVAAAGAYVYSAAAPTCGSDWTLDRVSDDLRANSHFDSVLMNGIKTESGGYLSGTQDCSAQVTEIRGNTSASDMTWRAVRYQVVRRPNDDHAVTVELGLEMPLAPPAPSFWQRLLADL